jgi:glycosyltransferase involved in cell wall biosynthesis
MTKRVLFFRDFLAFSGGHLKVWDYFNHVRASGDHSAHIHFSKASVWDESNPWLALRGETVSSWREFRRDILFLGGLDWRMMDAAEREQPASPVVNFVQNVKHGWPENPRFQYLKHRAIRICVGEEIGASIRATGQVNGPVFVIPLGLNLGQAIGLRGTVETDTDILIAALKQPAAGAELAELLRRPGRRLELLTAPLPRDAYLAKVLRARVTVFLPNPAEGVYLPPLEGMALGTLVICARVPGTEYCRDGDNCFYPEYSTEALRASAESALALGDAERRRLLAQAASTAANYDLLKERRAFLEILRNIDQLW